MRLLQEKNCLHKVRKNAAKNLCNSLLVNIMCATVGETCMGTAHDDRTVPLPRAESFVAALIQRHHPLSGAMPIPTQHGKRISFQNDGDQHGQDFLVVLMILKTSGSKMCQCVSYRAKYASLFVGWFNSHRCARACRQRKQVGSFWFHSKPMELTCL